jgi:hypothetical protein
VTADHVTFSKQYLICRFKRHHDSKEPSSTARAYKSREQSCDAAFSLHIYSDHVEFYTKRGVIRRRELVTVLGSEESEVSRDLEAKLNTSEALDQVRTRFFEVNQYSNWLDTEDKDRLLNRWEDELAAFCEAFIGHSLTEWLARD